MWNSPSTPALLGPFMVSSVLTPVHPAVTSAASPRALLTLIMLHVLPTASEPFVLCQQPHLVSSLHLHRRLLFHFVTELWKTSPSFGNFCKKRVHSSMIPPKPHVLKPGLWDAYGSRTSTQAAVSANHPNASWFQKLVCCCCPGTEKGDEGRESDENYRERASSFLLLQRGSFLPGDREEVIAGTRTWSLPLAEQLWFTSLEMTRLLLLSLRLFSRPQSPPSSFLISTWYHYSCPRLLGHKLWIFNHCITLPAIFHMCTEESVKGWLDAKEDTWCVLDFGQEATRKMSDRGQSKCYVLAKLNTGLCITHCIFLNFLICANAPCHPIFFPLWTGQCCAQLPALYIRKPQKSGRDLPCKPLTLHLQKPFENQT